LASGWGRETTRTALDPFLRLAGEPTIGSWERGQRRREVRCQQSASPVLADALHAFVPVISPPLHLVMPCFEPSAPHLALTLQSTASAAGRPQITRPPPATGRTRRQRPTGGWTGGTTRGQTPGRGAATGRRCGGSTTPPSSLLRRGAAPTTRSGGAGAASLGRLPSSPLVAKRVCHVRRAGIRQAYILWLQPPLPAISHQLPVVNRHQPPLVHACPPRRRSGRFSFGASSPLTSPGCTT
jgi:hypothetical protein